MPATIWTVAADRPDERLIAEAAAVVRSGGLVAFPTETVYGLAADASNPAAIERLNRVKGRPPEKPYSLHLYDETQVHAYVASVPPAAQRLMDRYWPGPLTIVMAGRDGRGVGFRLPDHAVCRAFLRLCGRAIAAPSANRSGGQPPTEAAPIVAELGGDIDGVLDAGPTPRGRESSVVQIAGGQVTVLREGAIPAEEILAACAS